MRYAHHRSSPHHRYESDRTRKHEPRMSPDRPADQARHARSVKARARWVEHEIYSIRRERTAETAERQSAKAHAIAVLTDWKRLQRLGIELQIAALEQVDHYRSEPHHFSPALLAAVGSSASIFGSNSVLSLLKVPPAVRWYPHIQALVPSSISALIALMGCTNICPQQQGTATSRGRRGGRGRHRCHRRWQCMDRSCGWCRCRRRCWSHQR
jgi:hypothetical protein